MADIYEKFFQAYWEPGMRAVFTDQVPKEMMQGPVDESGWYNWKVIPGTLSNTDYETVEKKFNINFPSNFIEWHRRCFFVDCDCSIVRLPNSLPTKPLDALITNLDWHIPEQLIPQGLIPFADEGNDAGPLVFDTRNQSGKTDFPIRVYDHEFGGDLEGLSEVIFSSFDKMIECLTHFLLEIKTKKRFEVLPDFFKIDPTGAGSTGRFYWTSWIEMERANFEEFGY